MFSRTLKRPLIAAAASSVLALGVSVAPASAATQQNGLVNVSLTDTNVQVPVAVAANVCHVTANVIATDAFTNNAYCDAASRSTATNGGGSGGNTKQSGLVNVSLTDTNVQVPIGIAANVCDVTANVITSGTFTANDPCSAIAPVSATG